VPPPPPPYTHTRCLFMCRRRAGAPDQQPDVAAAPQWGPPRLHPPLPKVKSVQGQLPRLPVGAQAGKHSRCQALAQPARRHTPAPACAVSPPPTRPCARPPPRPSQTQPVPPPNPPTHPHSSARMASFLGSKLGAVARLLSGEMEGADHGGSGAHTPTSARSAAGPPPGEAPLCAPHLPAPC
jgi:hypothetical protein